MAAMFKPGAFAPRSFGTGFWARALLSHALLTLGIIAGIRVAVAPILRAQLSHNRIACQLLHRWWGRWRDARVLQIVALASVGAAVGTLGKRPRGNCCGASVTCMRR